MDGVYGWHSPWMESFFLYPGVQQLHISVNFTPRVLFLPIFTTNVLVQTCIIFYQVKFNILLTGLPASIFFCPSLPDLSHSSQRDLSEMRVRSCYFRVDNCTGEPHHHGNPSGGLASSVLRVVGPSLLLSIFLPPHLPLSASKFPPQLHWSSCSPPFSCYPFSSNTLCSGWG